MSIFSGANEARMTGNTPPRLSDYHGKHVVKLGAFKTGVSQGKKRGQPYVAVDLEIIKSNNPDALPGLKLGTALLRDSQWPEYFFSDCKRIVAAFTGTEPEKVKEGHLQKAASEANPLAGRYAVVIVGSKIKQGKEVPDLQWMPGGPDSDVGAVLPKAANTDRVAPAAAAAASAPTFGADDGADDPADIFG